jgi:hypothetical protein
MWRSPIAHSCDLDFGMHSTAIFHVEQSLNHPTTDAADGKLHARLRDAEDCLL